jgi:hypothetical protein
MDNRPVAREALTKSVTRFRGELEALEASLDLKDFEPDEVQCRIEDVNAAKREYEAALEYYVTVLEFGGDAEPEFEARSNRDVNVR